MPPTTVTMKHSIRMRPPISGATATSGAVITPAKRGEGGAQRVGDRPRARHVDAEELHHEVVAGAGADHEAEVGLVEQQPQQGQQHRGDDQDEDAVAVHVGGAEL